ncbi:MAG: CDGSH iron-sulfur domain-containing protein [Steroidobacteraceae bacterium]
MLQYNVRKIRARRLKLPCTSGLRLNESNDNDPIGHDWYSVARRACATQVLRRRRVPRGRAWIDRAQRRTQATDRWRSRQEAHEAMNAQVKPEIARLKPYLAEVEAGKAYFWCACGRSKKQPYCDGSHRGTGLEPRKFVAAVSEEVLLCACKQTGTAPFCDGAHTNLPGGSPLDDPNSPANRAVGYSKEIVGARTILNGGCYVFSPAHAKFAVRGSLSYCDVVSGGFGATYQSQILLRVTGDASPIMTFGDCHTALFVSKGSGSLSISGRRFALQCMDGAYIRPFESFELAPAAGSTLEVFASACPRGAITWVDTMRHDFDNRFPERIVSVDEEHRTAMGPRWFQILVDKRIGSDVITQFIGHIPESKAAPHRHLYEEAIIVHSGAGCMWTEDRKSDVRAGDVIFLPRKQKHSLQATTLAGMNVVGVIYPGDNPSINY